MTTSIIPKSARYDPSGLLGSPSPVNIVVGARSLGKTYGFTKYAVRNYLNNGEEWIYLRRYDTELKDSSVGGKEGVFAALIKENEFPKHEFRVEGSKMQIRLISKSDDKGDPWQTFGYMMALSKAQSYKGTNLPKVTTIFYDEFILERKVPPYLKNEPDVLMNFWETIDRRNNRVRLYLAANAANIVNPYFMQWNLQIPTKGKTKTYKIGRSSITVQYADDAIFKTYARETTIGAFTSGSSYENYALENTFKGDDGAFIAKKTSKALYAYCLIIKGEEYGIWCDAKRGEYFINKQILDDDEKTFVLIKEDLRPNVMILERIHPILVILKRAVQYGCCYFSDVKVKQSFLNGMELLGIR